MSATAPETTDRLVYAFEEGGRDGRDLLGGKGANLAEMTRLGLPVPPGFIVTTEACRAYLVANELPHTLLAEVDAALANLEDLAGKRFGDPQDPLLLSVRSGAPFSMPGMMDTVLNLGMTDATVAGLAEVTGDERFAHDAHRRFVLLFGKVVLGVPGERFEEALAHLLEQRGLRDERELNPADLRALAHTFEEVIEAETDTTIPDDPREQLVMAIEAVFRSWNSRRARNYRRMEGIPDDLGTAVNVQAMVFGNLGRDSGSGVAFTRNPASGEPAAYGDWLEGAQGEDVVSGTRMTRPLAELGERFPECARQLEDIMRTLERHYQDMCDIEFTIERGRLYMLQTRVGKRTAQAAVRMAVDMVDEGLIDEREAVSRVTPAQLEQLLHPQFDPLASYDPLTTGLEASPGAATGSVVFTADEAEERASHGEEVILVRPETSPDDLHGMIASQGILTSRGGLVSHAAVVARGMGKPAVCGASELTIDVSAGIFRASGTTVRAGDVISISGTTGEVVVGEVPRVVPQPESGAAGTLLSWADRLRRLEVRANADTAEDAERARRFGAEGIGLCRTEHMFLGDRLPVVQRMILAADEHEEQAALEELREVQVKDFTALLRAMDGLPVTVRFLDPPLHEFLPDLEDLVAAEARGELDGQGRALLAAARSWHEDNPMLGIRGCRLAILKPGLYEMQARALIDAAVVVKDEGGEPDLEIMIPLVSLPSELAVLSERIRKVIAETLAEADADVSFRIGTMIETPRAALMAGDLAQHAAFFSFGTNDLTQMVYGFSRDDVEARMMPMYEREGLLRVDPFRTIDPDGVGRLLRIGAEEGRAANPTLALGLCGEHGGDPESVRFCHDAGLDYVSCSPFRIPVARLAAAHAALGADGRDAAA